MMDDAMIEERTSETLHRTWNCRHRFGFLVALVVCGVDCPIPTLRLLSLVESCQHHRKTFRTQSAGTVGGSDEGWHQNALHEVPSAPKHPPPATGTELPWDHPLFPIPPATNESHMDHTSRGLAFASSASLSPKYHARQPDAFRLCGTSSPTLHGKRELGRAHAAWDDNRERARLWSSEQQGRAHLSNTMDAITTSNSNETTATAPSKIVIPVWFHVLQWDDTWGKLATEQVEELFMPALESAYSANTPFAFQLKGVTSTIHRKWYYCKGQNRYKKRLRRGGKATLNVYVCDMVGSLERGGDAYFPYVVRNSERAHFDGIRIMNPALGGAHYAAQALVHEVGHYLGLLHTFEGGCETDERYHYGRYPGYYFAGDGVRDTPAQAVPTMDIPPNSTCWLEDRINTCRDRRRKNGAALVDPGRDLVSNYMNYLTSTCYYWYGTFTPGQVGRMVAQYEMYRKPR